MYWKYLIKQINPWSTWSRLFLALCLPPAIYLQDMMLIVVLVVASLVLTLVSPITKKKIEIEFLFHVIRGHFLEISGKVPHNSMIWRILMGSAIMKFVTFTILAGLFGFSIYLLWNENLFWGSAIFYAIISLKMCVLSEWSNLSKMTPSNQEWDDIYQVTIEE